MTRTSSCYLLFIAVSLASAQTAIAETVQPQTTSLILRNRLPQLAGSNGAISRRKVNPLAKERNHGAGE
jgi:hypothetical protein